MHGKEVKGLETRENTGNRKSRIPLRHDFQQQFPSTKLQTTISFRWLLSSEHFIQYKSLYKTKNLKSHRGFYLRDGRHASPWSRRTPAVLVLLVCIPRTIQIRRYPCALPRASDKIKKQTFTKQCASCVDDVGCANCSQLLIVQYQYWKYKFANDLHFVKS